MVDKSVERVIGLLPGTGKQGKGLAMRLIQAGYKVYLGSRKREKAEEAAKYVNQKIGIDGSTGLTNAEVAEKANLVFLVVPFENVEETIQELEPKLQPGTILVDVVVPLIFQEGFAACSSDMPFASVSEFIQSLVPEKVTVVGAFKTISAPSLANIKKTLEYDIFLTSDSKEAKKELKTILSKIEGLRILDAGGLRFSQTTEQMTALVINLNKLNKLKHASFKVVSKN